MEKLTRVLDLYKEDKLLQSARVLEELTAYVHTTLNDVNVSGSQKEEALRVQERLEQSDVKRIVAEIGEVRHLKESLNSKNGWSLSYDGAETKVWYRREPSSSSHSMLVEGNIVAPLINVAALLYELDLYSDLLWFIKHAKLLEENGRLRRSAHFLLYAPWPLYDREVALYGYAVDGLDEDDCILVASRSLQREDNVQIHSEITGSLGKRTVNANVQFAGYELVPVTPSVTRVRCIFNADPQLSIVPMPLINWSSRMFCRWSLRAMESRAQKLPPSYQQRKDTKVIYKWFESRLATYWQTKGKADEYAKYKDTHPDTQQRNSGDFDVNETPEGPPRAVIASLLSGSPSNSSDSVTRSRSRNLASRLFSMGSTSR